MVAFRHKSSLTDYIFFITDMKKYAVISYAGGARAGTTTTTKGMESSTTMMNPQSRNLDRSGSVHHFSDIITHSTGDLADYGLAIRGNEPEGGTIAALESNHHSCIALHLYEGFVTILPIEYSYAGHTKGLTSTASSSLATGSRRWMTHTAPHGILGLPFHCRIEERDVFDMCFLMSSEGSTSKRTMPQLALLHQDSRGNQHVIAHSIDFSSRSLVFHSQASPLTSKKGSENSGSGSQSQTTISSDLANAVPLSVQYRLKKSRVDGSSGIIVAVPPFGPSPPIHSNTAESSMMLNDSDAKLPVIDTNLSCPMGGILIFGESQITYHDTARSCTQILAIDNFITLSYAYVEPEPSDTNLVVRYLIGDDSGKIHILALVFDNGGLVTIMHIESLGVTNTSSSLQYLNHGLVFVASQMTDSQLIQILDEPVVLSKTNGASLLDGKHVTYINILEEYINIGPIVDFQMVPTSHHSSDQIQYMAVTASGAQKDGTVRLVRNGIGMTEYASIELGGIKGMWSIRKTFHDSEDTYILQSFVSETRILGVVLDNDVTLDDGEDTTAILAETQIMGIDDSKSTLFATNVFMKHCSDSSLMIQVTEKEVRLVSIAESKCVATWQPADGSLITLATVNEAGQIAVAMRGGLVIYLELGSTNNTVSIEYRAKCEMSSEVSCMNLNSFCDRIKAVDSAFVMDSENDDEKKSHATTSKMLAIGLWDECNAKLLSLNSVTQMHEITNIDLRPTGSLSFSNDGKSMTQHGMARSICLATLDSTSTDIDDLNFSGDNQANKTSQDMLLIGLGDGRLISFVVKEGNGILSIEDKKEVKIGTRAISLVPITSNTDGVRGTCIIATGDKPTVVYLSGGGSKNTRLCYSNIHLTSESEFDESNELVSLVGKQSLVVNVAAAFHSTALFGQSSLGVNSLNYSLCTADDSTLRLGLIDDIQKLHITTHKLGMSPRRVAYDENSRMVCVGCIDSGVSSNRSASMGASNIVMGNCVRFFDDSTFVEIDRFDLDDYETIEALESMQLSIADESNEHSESEAQVFHQFIVIGTAYSFPEEVEPSLGRIIILKCSRGGESLSRKSMKVTSVQVKGGVFSISEFFNGTFLATINSKTRLCKLVGGKHENDPIDLKIVGAGHHGHILSLVVHSLAKESRGTDDVDRIEQLAIVGDMVRSVSVVKFYPEFETLEEVARDFNQNWITAAAMITNDVYIGAENFYNLIMLRRNPNADHEEIRCRLDTIGLFNLGEMINKFRTGSLVTTSNSSSATSSTAMLCEVQSNLELTPCTGNQTMFGTVDGTLGSIIGVDARSTAFFLALQRAMNKVLPPIGDLRHEDFRSYRGQRNSHPSRAFVDGDLIESFSYLEPPKMELIVKEMNDEAKWDIAQIPLDVDEESLKGTKNQHRILTVKQVLSMVDDISLSH